VKAKRHRKHARGGAGRLVRAYAEKLPGSVLSVFWKEFRSLVHGHGGIYVLYKENVPHYVGRAASLSWRIRHHQRDRLKGKWDAFSFYSVKKKGHVKHLESLLLRIVEQEGARVSGRLPGAENLRVKLMVELKRTAAALKDLKKKT
jgi:hypothetical protein